MKLKELYDELDAHNAETAPHVRTTRKRARHVNDASDSQMAKIQEEAGPTPAELQRRARQEMRAAFVVANTQAQNKLIDQRRDRKEKEKAVNAAKRASQQAAKHGRYAAKDPEFAARLQATKASEPGADM